MTKKANPAPPAAKKTRARKPKASIVDLAAVSAAALPSRETVIAQMESDLKVLSLQKDILLMQVKIDHLNASNAAIANKQQMREMQMEIALLRAESELEDVRRRRANDAALAALKTDQERAAMERSIQESVTEAYIARVKLTEGAMRHQITALQLGLKLRKKEALLRYYAEEPPVYLADPLQNDVLTISDRRILLPHVIHMGTAKHFSERLAYYNNKDRELPVFLVIDICYGGSVMAGLNILKAIRDSSAPVFVVVKTFAASMAAAITALAPRSFAYPNAILLHHQIITGWSHANLTQLREELNFLQEWWRRLGAQVAEKMGLSSEEFVREMYAHNSDGDWEEFADRAQELKWVDHVVREIRDTGQWHHPDMPSPAKERAKELAHPPHHDHDALALPAEAESRVLPRLRPPDGWWLYNRDGFYRMES